jgi:hypothetical protein
MILSRVARMSSGVARVLRADLRPMRLGEGADALADSMLARGESVLALVDLIDDSLAPVGGVGAACDRRLRGDARSTYGEQSDCKTDGSLGRDHGYRLGEDGHMKTSLEICGVVLRLDRRWAGAASFRSFLVKLLLQPLVESVAASHAHSSRGTVEAVEVPKTSSVSPSRRLRSLLLAAASREATVRSGTFKVAAISRFVKP